MDCNSYGFDPEGYNSFNFNQQEVPFNFIITVFILMVDCNVPSSDVMEGTIFHFEIIINIKACLFVIDDIKIQSFKPTVNIMDQNFKVVVGMLY